MMLPKGITFEGFWPGFDTNDNFLTRLIRFTGTEHLFRNSSFTCKSVFSPNSHELIAISNLAKHLMKRVFLQNSLREPVKASSVSSKDSRKTVWYTGENVRPPLDIDISLSFDQDTYSGANIYFPLIYDTLLTSLLGDSDVFFGDIIVSDYLIGKREVTRIPAPSIATFINNGTPHRIRAIKAFERNINVAVYGKLNQKPLVRKSDVKDKFKFVMCFENDSYPGYITEKLLHAYALGSVPVYWGNLGKEFHLNRQAFINAEDFDSLDDLALFLKNMPNTAYETMYAQPLFNTTPDYNQVVEQIIARCLR